MRWQQRFSTLFKMLVIAIAGYLVSYGMNIYASRTLLVEEFGSFYFTLKILRIGGKLLILGIDSGCKRFLSKYLKTQQKDLAYEFTKWSLLSLCKSSSLFLIISGLLIIIYYLCGANHNARLQEFSMPLLCLWLCPIVAFGYLLTGYLASIAKYLQVSFITYFSHYLILFGLMFLAFSVFKQPHSNMSFVLLFFATFFIVVIIQLWMLKDKRYKLTQLLSNLKTVKIKMNNIWLKFSLIIAINNGLFFIISFVDLTMLGLYSKDPKEMGYYSAALAIVTFMNIIARQTSQYIQPQLSYYFEHKPHAEFQKLLDHFNIFKFMIIIICTLGIAYFATPLLISFGPTYIQAKTVLLILLLGNAIDGLLRTAFSVLAFTGSEAILLPLSIYELLGLTILTYLGTQYFGMVGTASAASFILMSKPIFATIIARRKVKARCVLVF
jgi:O-antigen/teichoic acid export membrane protein